MSELERAAAALDAEDPATALVVLVGAWRELRAPELADVIEELSEIVDTPPLDARKGSALRQELEARARRDDPVDLTRLVGVPLPRALDDTIAWLRVLAEREHDPRFATYLHGLLDAPPSGQNKFWKVAFELVAAAGDPRSIVRLETFDTRLPEVARPSSIDFAERRRGAALEALRTRFVRGVPALGDADRQVVARLRERLRERAATARSAGRDGEELLAAIRANPGDDQLRLVYADFLQQRGDPRGELIALQLGERDAACTRRANAIIAAHGTTWLGSIAQIATAAKMRWARGFPVAVTLNARTEAQLEAVVGAPEWATIEELAFTGPHTSALACAAIVCHPAARGLRVVRGLGTRPAATVASASPPLALVTLGAALFGDLPHELRDCRGLPRLERIELDQPAWFARLDALVSLRGAPVARRLRALAWTSGGTTVELAGDALGELTRLRLVFEHPDAVDARAAELRELARSGFTDIVIAAPAAISDVIDARVARLLPHSLPCRIEHL